MKAITPELFLDCKEAVSKAGKLEEQIAARIDHILKYKSAFAKKKLNKQ